MSDHQPPITHHPSHTTTPTDDHAEEFDMLADLWTSPQTPLPDVSAMYARMRRRERLEYVAEALAALWAISTAIVMATRTPIPAMLVLAVVITVFMVTHAAWEWRARWATRHAMYDAHTRGFLSALKATEANRLRSATWTRRYMPAVLGCCLIWAMWLIEARAAHYLANPADAIGGVVVMCLISAGAWWWAGKKQREHTEALARYDAWLAELGEDASHDEGRGRR